MHFDEDSLEINLSDDNTQIKVNIDEDGLEIEKKSTKERNKRFHQLFIKKASHSKIK